MKTVPEIKFDIPSAEVLEEMVNQPLPLGLPSDPVAVTFHRDIYFDTPDRVLEQRGASCRIRMQSDDRRFLAFRTRPRAGAPGGGLADETFSAEVAEADPRAILSGSSPPARRLGAFVDPARLAPIFELEVQRVTRRVRRGILRRPLLDLCYDTVTVRQGESAQVFRELKVRQRRGDVLEPLARALEDRFGLRAVLSTKAERARRRLEALETEALAREVRGSRQVTVFAMEDHRVAVLYDGNTMWLPVQDGSGEDVARAVMKDFLGSTDGQIRLLGTAAAAGTRPLLEVWLVEGLPPGASREAAAGREWILVDEILSRVGSPVLREPATLAALAVVARSNIVPVRSTGQFAADALAAGQMTRRTASTRETRALTALQLPDLPSEALDAAQPVPDQFINEQLSWLEFNNRVLSLAEDPGTPLLARLGFLAIFSSNMDEFFMVRIGILKHAVATGETRTSIDGLTPQEELDAISIRLAPLVARQRRVFRQVCLPDLERRGIRIRNWDDLNDEERIELQAFFDGQVFPVLTPQAMTQAPGHPFPHLANLTLSLAVMVRDRRGGPSHFANIKMPAGLPRFVALAGTHDFVPIEQIVRHNLRSIYPGHDVEEAHVFRITRAGDISVDETRSSNLLLTIEEEVKRRPFGSVVRIEVEASMPQVMRDLLQRELTFEEVQNVSTLNPSDIVEADDLVDLGGLRELAELPMPDLQYPPFEGSDPFPDDQSLFDLIRAGDRLVHHPYDAFESSVRRLIEDAADDPDVMAIRMTLYRGGRQSAIVDALTRAAGAGKDVSVFVELKARFDEERNIRWARTLEQAGIHVVTGLVKLKTHAKITLIVRREGSVIRRYVHVGSGNYNAATAHLYTDLGLLSCDENLAADLNDVFNALTGSSGPPTHTFRRMLVAPTHMLDQFTALIEREVEHARAGRGGRIRVKLNGLADRQIIGELYRASQAGVEIDLIVRGICALRPGVPGLSEHIRVFSIVGRFLEHARIFHFGNGGDDEYFIGSADWRPRNLRHRVEVVTPVDDPEACRRLDEILEMELDDPTAWLMRSDGGYGRLPPPVGVDVVSAQEQFMERARQRGACQANSHGG